MKKYHLYLWIIALIGMITSCSQEETANALQTATDANRVTLTASLPEDFAQIGPRANKIPAFPTGHKLRCILEIWDEKLTTLKVRKEVCPTAGDTNIGFTFELDNGTYNALLWADYIKEETEPKATDIAGLSGVQHYEDEWYNTNYDTDGLKDVRIRYANGDLEQRDAFFAAKKFAKEAMALKDLTVTLTRPLAKLTIAEKNTTNFDYCESVNPTYNIPNALDVSTGIVSLPAAQSISYGFGEDITINGTSCKVLFSDYIFATDNSTMPEIRLEFTPKEGSGKTLNKVTIPAGIPLKRNYRVNAAGTLILAQDAPSKAVNMTVDITSDWANQEVEHEITTIWDGTYPTSADEAKEWMGAETSGAGETDGSKHVFTITTPRQLAALHVLVMNDTELSGTSTNKEYKYATYKLANDIDLANAQWSPIGHKTDGYTAFTGKFDGQAHKISGLNVDGEWTASGLFAGISNGGVIKNVMVKGKVASSYNNNTASIAVGGIAGRMSNATIAFCSFEGTTDASSANVSSLFIGGICGRVSTQATVDNNITSCFANTTPIIPQGLNDNNVSKGGIGGTNNGGMNIHFKGCTWYYKSGATPEGIEACYEDWTSSNDRGNKNASYSDFSDLSNRLDDMNSYNSDPKYEYEYKWAIENNILKLQPKN